MIQTLWKIVWFFLKKSNIDLPYNQAIPWLGIYSKELKIENQTDTCMSVLIATYSQ